RVARRSRQPLAKLGARRSRTATDPDLRPRLLVEPRRSNARRARLRARRRRDRRLRGVARERVAGRPAPQSCRRARYGPSGLAAPVLFIRKPSALSLDRLMVDARRAEPTYADIGATRERRSPDGYRGDSALISLGASSLASRSRSSKHSRRRSGAAAPAAS